MNSLQEAEHIANGRYKRFVFAFGGHGGRDSSKKEGDASVLGLLLDDAPSTSRGKSTSRGTSVSWVMMKVDEAFVRHPLLPRVFILDCCHDLSVWKIDPPPESWSFPPCESVSDHRIIIRSTSPGYLAYGAPGVSNELVL